jgi:hypothetical protein
MVVTALLILALAGQEPSSVMNQIDNPEEVHLWGQGTADGKNYDFVVSEIALQKTPEWFPEKQDPPFTIPQAIAAAKKAALADHPKFDDLVTSSVEIRRVGAFRSKNRWFYRVEFNPVIEGQTFFGNDITVVLLMDGTVVKPREKSGHW